MLKPKLFTTLKNYTHANLLIDGVAGIVVGIVALPLAIAFGIASGVSPEKGLFTAIIAGFLISALGGSRVQIGGPTGAFVVIVYGIVHQYGVDGLTTATLMAGVFLVVMGLARFGVIIKFIPHTVIVGFTSGIAVVIFSSQIKDFFGLEAPSMPADFIEKWKVLFEHAGSFNPYAILIAVSTVVLISVWPKVSRRVPGSLVAILIASACAAAFHWPVETIGSRFGELPHTLPKPELPHLDLSTMQHLIRPAFTIALLAGIESLLSAVVADGMIGGRHRSNMELVAQGVANVGSALFGGMPATGAIARTVTNVKNGGRTPVAGIVHALTVLVAMLFLGKWITWVPLACLAGILVVVSYHMSEWRSFLGLLRGPKGAILILLTTFLLTVVVDLTLAIELGLLLSALKFIFVMSEVKNIRVIKDAISESDLLDDRLRTVPLPEGVDIYELNGPLFFGAANQFEEADRIVAEKPRVRILRFKDVPMMDSTALNALKSFHKKCKSRDIHLVVTGLHVQPLNEIVKSDLYDLIGADNVFGGMKEALARAEALLQRSS